MLKNGEHRRNEQICMQKGTIFQDNTIKNIENMNRSFTSTEIETEI